MRRPNAVVGIVARPWIFMLGSLALLVVLGAMLRRGGSSGAADDLVVYCAAGVKRPVEAIVAQYQWECGVRVRIDYGGSGALLSKLRLAPESADLFLAAEISYLDEARSRGLVAEVLPLAKQRVVIGVQPGNPKKLAKIADLLRSDVRVSIPNPELAAVGKAAQRVLGATRTWDALQARSRGQDASVSMVGTVTEAAQAVKIGATDAAIVWDTTARQFELECIEPAEFLAAAAEEVVVGVVSQSKHPTGALHLARYLAARDRGQPAFRQTYFAPPDEADVWEDRPELVLMAGAMLKPAIDETVKRFAAREGVSISTIYNGCGIHVAQMKAMKEGRMTASHFPDAYFSCDTSFMNHVQQWFEASRSISRNDIVLAVRKGNPLGVRSIVDLTRPELRVGLTHPVNSALGKLTDDLLKKLDLHEKVYAKDRKYPISHVDAGHMLVNQLHAAALDLAAVYRSNVLSRTDNPDRNVEIVEMNLPEAVAIQPYAVSKDTSHKLLMRRLLQAILLPESKARFDQSGFHWVAEGPSQ